MLNYTTFKLQDGDSCYFVKKKQMQFQEKLAIFQSFVMHTKKWFQTNLDMHYPIHCITLYTALPHILPQVTERRFVPLPGNWNIFHGPSREHSSRNQILVTYSWSNNHLASRRILRNLRNTIIEALDEELQFSTLGLLHKLFGSFYWKCPNEFTRCFLEYGLL